MIFTKIGTGNVISRLLLSLGGSKLRFHILFNAVLQKLLAYATLAAPSYASWGIDADAYYENYRLLTEHDRYNE
jgi:hypothetical protein